MSEETNGEYTLQISGKVHGDLVVVRGNSPEEFADTLEGLAQQTDRIVSAWSDFKVGAVTKGIFTGDAVTDKSTSKPSKSSKSEVGSNGIPRCKHGEMKDLRHKNYRSDFYCPSTDRDNQCDPVKL